MKVIEIDETKDKIVLQVQNSSVARVVDRNNAVDVHAALLEILEAAPEQRPSDEKEAASAESEVDDGDVDGAIEDARATVNALLDMGRELLGSPEGQKVKGKLEGVFPKTKRMKKNSA